MRTSLRRYIQKYKAKGQENVTMSYGPGGRRVFSDKVELEHAVNL